MHSRESGPGEDQLTGLLADLVSEPRFDRVLDKITEHARETVGAGEIALLLEGGGIFTCAPHSRLSDRSRRSLEGWAGENAVLALRAQMIESIEREPGLFALEQELDGDGHSLCAAPLRYGQRALGILVALGDASAPLGEAELSKLEDYAVQAAIALANARLFERQEALAKRDPLTGLLNHREFHETVASELSRSRR